MKCYTPQSLADLFQLNFVLKGFLWYGCEAVPQWTDKGWKLDNAKVSVILLKREVLASCGERESLTYPQTCENGAI